jgi:hypothetical protein
MRYIKFAFGKIFNSLRFEKEINGIKEELKSLYKKYELIHWQKMSETSQNNTQSASSSKDTSSSLASIVPTKFQSFLESTTTKSSKSKLLIYLDEPNISITYDKKFDLLNFWKVNAHRFPVVSSVAKRFLAIPACSVSSEQIFSTGGRIIDDYRSSLKPETVQALVCASSWIRGSQSAPICLVCKYTMLVWIIFFNMIPFLSMCVLFK